VLVAINGQPIGVEVTELVHANRIDEDKFLDKLKIDILREISPGEHTRNCIVQLSLHESYGSRVEAKGCTEAVSAFLNKELPRCTGQRNTLRLPTDLQRWFESIVVERSQAINQLWPSISFTADATYIISDVDFPPLVARSIGKKLAKKTSGVTWLLVWAETPGIDVVRNELLTDVQHLRRARLSHTAEFFCSFLPLRCISPKSISIDKASLPFSAVFR
jgi:hypothetical protein